jgi:hypothetical protein
MTCTDCPRTATHDGRCRDCYESSVMRATRAQQEARTVNGSPFGIEKKLKNTKR